MMNMPIFSFFIMKKEIQILKSRYLQSTIFFLCIILVGILAGFNMRGKKNIEREQLEALSLDVYHQYIPTNDFSFQILYLDKII